MSASATIARAPQHLQALQRANEIRLARAELKRRIAEGHLSAAEIVLACPPEVEGMAVADLLMSQRRWGRTRCRKFLAAIPLAENKSIGSMTDRQRKALAIALPKRSPVREACEVAPRSPEPVPVLAGVA
jgi:recombinational DNA repair protein RecR